MGKVILPVLQLRQSGNFAEPFPELRFNGSHADIFPVLCPVHIIIMGASSKGRIPCHPAAQNAGQGNDLHAKGRIIQADIDALPFAAPLPGQQRHGNGGHGVQAAADGRHLHLTDSHIPAVIQEIHAGKSDNIQIMGRLLFKFALLSKTRNGAIHQPRIQRVHRFIPQPFRLQITGTESFNKNICLLQQFLQDLLSLFRFYIYRNAFFVSIQGQVPAAHTRRQLWRKSPVGISLHPFNLNYIRPKIRQYHTAILAGQPLGKINYFNSLQSSFHNFMILFSQCIINETFMLITLSLNR